MLGEPLAVLAPLRYAPPVEHSSLSPYAYQFRVVVQVINPLIWRRILIRSDMSLATLHATLRKRTLSV
jgi:hypothetical protein